MCVQLALIDVYFACGGNIIIIIIVTDNNNTCLYIIINKVRIAYSTILQENILVTNIIIIIASNRV
jgi:hypothetical protein